MLRAMSLSRRISKSSINGLWIRHVRRNNSCVRLEPLRDALRNSIADVELVRKQTFEDAAWLHTERAKNCIRLFYENFPSSVRNTSGDIVDYIHSRTDKYSEQVDCHQLSTQRVLSSLLTFPLTLSYGLNKLFLSPSRAASDASSYSPQSMLQDGSINVLVVGARAESSLPLVWWQEMLHTCNFDNVNIRMIGPQLQETKNPRVQATSTGGVEVKRCVSIAGYSSPGSTSSDRTTLHQHSQLLSLLQWAHVFVLFNPGYGSLHSKDDWDPTVRLLLQTRKPVLCTAYGNQDLRRDLSALDLLTAEEDSQELGEPIDFLLPPHDNPFKSFRFAVDARESADQGIVITNHIVYAVAAK